MIILEHSIYDGETIAANLGLSEYSYWFVRKAFRPALQRFGVVAPVAKPAQEVDRIYHSARAHGEACVFLSFSPPHQTPVGLACPTVPVFAWEFDTIPDEAWNHEPHNDWTEVLSRLPAAITHSRFSMQAVRRRLGGAYPIWSIPAPVFDGNAPRAASARGWREPFDLLLGDALVFDAGRLDLSLFAHGADTRGASAFRHLQKAAAEPGRSARRITFQGVVYTAVLNPADGRKNWSDMIAGFIYAFRREPDATLVLKTTHRDPREGVIPILQEIARLGAFRCRILIVHGMLDDEAYAGLLDATSYAVNTSHGEGQCLPLMEYMSAGRPAVSPRHTAMLEYVSPQNAFIVADHHRPSFWPHDMRQASRCLRHQIEFADLVRRYRESFAVARDEPAHYARMSLAATAALRAYCADEVVTARLGEVFGHLGLAHSLGSLAVVTTAGPAHQPPAAPPVDAERIDPFFFGLRDAMISGWYDKAAGELAPGFPVGPEDVVIDVGCGDGGAIGFCANLGAHVILADQDEARIRAAARRMADTPARMVEVYVTDAHALPMADAIASRVICTEVLEHVDDPAAFAAELVRVGRPGALYLITVPDPVQEKLQLVVAPPTYFQKPNHIRIFEREAFAALIEDAGLVIERRSSYGFFWAMWWVFFWQADVPLSGDAPHPALDAWTRCWSEVLKGKDGMKIKRMMDEFMPKAQVIVARKPV